MKKIIIFVMVIVVFIPLINIVPFTYCRINYHDDDTIYEDLKANIDFYNAGKSLGLYQKYYGDNILPVLETTINIDFEPISRTDAIKLLFFNDIDKISRSASMPLFGTREEVSPLLGNIQFFEFEGKNFLLCHYMHSGVGIKLYSYEINENLNTLLNKDCFITKKLFQTTRKVFIETSVHSALKNYIPILILTAICFVPFLFTGKKDMSQKRKKIITIMVKTGFFAIPIGIIFYFIKIYDGIDLSPLVSLFE